MLSYDPNKVDGLWSNGPVPGKLYNLNNCSNNAAEVFNGPLTRGQPQPVQPGPTICTSVLGMKFNGGVLLAADNLVSYGSLARFNDVQRVFKINNKCVLGVMGDFADFQSLQQSIEQKMIDDFCHDDSIEMKADAMYNWLTRVMYNRRSNMNPLFIELAVAGLDNDGEPFLGHIDSRGRSYKDPLLGTGLGKHLVLPYLREVAEERGIELTQNDALECMKKAMELLYYRDCRGASSYSVAVCTKTDGSKVLGPLRVDENWILEAFVGGQ